MPRSKLQGAPAKSVTGRKLPGRKQTDDDIFALDIGTRNVVGIIGHMEDGVFFVDEAVSIPHKRRDMLDGQIEDIGGTASIVNRVKEELENLTGISLSSVAIAAAGRALQTKRSFVENDIEGKDKINEAMLKALELEAVSAAQAELDKENHESNINFYCVGHTVINYKLDDYPIRSLLGHKGKKASVELIAAFLPSIVVESLYTVMDMNGLEVASLTLEPIAAMNVIIPPDVRLINIALVDIGAGTTDIAISQGGSIVAYAMATTAGDEITEDIIRKYLVDFDTAENMKMATPGEDIEFIDILGFEHTIESADFYQSLFPVVQQLADTIAENILEANGGAPAAVFLVGGGSLIPDLPMLVAERLQIPENRVAIGGQSCPKNIDIGEVTVLGPEFVTPIGIGITATLQTGYDFSQVTLNGNKIRIFDTKAVTAADLLINAGFKTSQIIGRSGRGLSFTLNGEKQTLKGETSMPAQITVNGLPVTLEYTIKQGDVIDFTPATIGQNASVCIYDLAGEVFSKKITIDGEEYSFGNIARVNDSNVTGDYSVQNYDVITVDVIETLGDLIITLPFDCRNLAFFKGDKVIRADYVLNENDSFITRDRREVTNNAQNIAREIAERDEKKRRSSRLTSNMPPIGMGESRFTSTPVSAPAPADQAPVRETVPLREQFGVRDPFPPVSQSVPAAEPAPMRETSSLRSMFSEEPVISAPTHTPAPITQPAPVQMPEAVQKEAPKPEPYKNGGMMVFLNDIPTALEPRSDGAQHEFLELMALADIDIGNPPSSGKMVLTLNGQNASFMDILHEGDRIVIKWDE